jgi:type VI secretion system protein ImpK
MRPTGISPSFGVLQQFQDFYTQIIELKRMAHAQSILPLQPGTIDVLPEGGIAGEIWRKAAAILDRQSLEALHMGPVAEAQHREARFIMAALADDAFVHPRWEGTDYWLSHLLETRFFHTHSAGDVFFSKLSALLISNDPSTDELAVVYLSALALGFRGKYFGDPHGDAVLNGLRVRLYELIKLRNPRLLDDSGHLFPDSYLSTIQEGVARRLPDPRIWVAIALVVVAGWFGVSVILWQLLTADIRKALPENKIEIQQNAAPAKP